uniref:PQ-loop repeat-containing protein 1 n=1 Tax=Schistocephalus solidus TaxID=70667 RepID=A0A183TPF8_SCHSO
LDCEKMLSVFWSLVDLTKSILPLFIVFGGALPYIPQYIEIKTLENSDGFSSFVCLTLLVANILRIAFWFGHPFPTPLLIQASVMICTMLAMTLVCVRFRGSHRRRSRHPDDTETETEHFFTDLEPAYFWRWTDFGSYLQFIAFFTFLAFSITFCFRTSSIYVQTLGFVALLTEAMLGLPQVITNFRNASTKGMRLVLLCFARVTTSSFN